MPLPTRELSTSCVLRLQAPHGQDGETDCSWKSMMRERGWRIIAGPGGFLRGGGTLAGLDGWERRMSALEMLTVFCKCIMFGILILCVNNLGMWETLSPVYG